MSIESEIQKLKDSISPDAGLCGEADRSKLENNPDALTFVCAQIYERTPIRGLLVHDDLPLHWSDLSREFVEDFINVTERHTSIKTEKSQYHVSISTSIKSIAKELNDIEIERLREAVGSTLAGKVLLLVPDRVFDFFESPKYIIPRLFIGMAVTFFASLYMMSLVFG
jgi:hypothetical protein